MPLLLLLLEELERRGRNTNLKNTADRIFFPLEKFLENIEENIDHVLSHLMRKLIILSLPPYENHLRQLAIEAIGTTGNFLLMLSFLNPYQT